MNVTVKDLLDAGVHFGHQVRRWNPKSKPYVYANRHGISIIDLEKTYEREAEVEAQQAVAKMSGTVAAISSLIFTVVVTMVTVPPLEMFGSTLSYGQ